MKLKELKKHMYGYKAVGSEGYGVFVFWGTGTEMEDMLRMERNIPLESMEEVKELHRALGKLIRDWGDTDCMKH